MAEQRAATQQVGASDNGEWWWSPLQFYAYVIRTFGIPKRWQHVDGEWVAHAPFTKPSARMLNNLEAHGV